MGNSEQKGRVMKKYKVGEVITFKVSGIEPYGIFVSVDKKYSGLIHISEISNEFVRNINDYVKLEEQIYCKIIVLTRNRCRLCKYCA